MIFTLHSVTGYGLDSSAKFGGGCALRFFIGFGRVVGMMGTLCVFGCGCGCGCVAARRVHCCFRVMLGLGSGLDWDDRGLKVCERCFVILAYAWLFAVWLSWFVGAWMGVVLVTS